MTNEEKILKKLKAIENSIKSLENKMDSINKTLFPTLKEHPGLESNKVKKGIVWDDELFVDACKVVLEHNTASASLLQRNLNIGYARAARLIDELVYQGLVIHKTLPYLYTYTKVEPDRELIEHLINEFEAGE